MSEAPDAASRSQQTSQDRNERLSQRQNSTSAQCESLSRVEPGELVLARPTRFFLTRNTVVQVLPPRGSSSVVDMTVASVIPMVELPSTFVHREFETVCQLCRIRSRLITQKTLSSFSVKIIQRSPPTPSPGLENAHGHKLQLDSDCQFAVRVLEYELLYFLAFLSMAPSPGSGLGQFPRNHAARSLRCRSTPLGSKGKSNGHVQGHVYCGMYISFCANLGNLNPRLTPCSGKWRLWKCFLCISCRSSCFIRLFAALPVSSLPSSLSLSSALARLGEKSSYKRRKLHISFAIRRQSIRYFRCCCDAFRCHSHFCGIRRDCISISGGRIYTPSN